MKIVTIVGARPQFIKAAPVSRTIRDHNEKEKDPQITEVLVHTGQHYDHGMSQIFFDELDISEPDLNLGVGSGSHGWQTGQILVRIEEVLLEEKPDFVVVYGDTNSTLAGALAAAKLHIPVAHVEAGLRSFNREMPEEHNRVVADHCADVLFCPTQTAVDNLAREGISKGVHLVGDTMYDAVLQFSSIARKRSTILKDMDLTPKSYLLTTIHRP
jgi:UDP-N-acetylglucosamine 2-epimerase